MAMAPDAQKAFTDCTASKKSKLSVSKVGDLPTCIADVEALIPGVEKAIADIKAGN